MVTATQAYLQLKTMLQQAGVSDAGFDAQCLLKHATGLSRFDSAELGAPSWNALRALAQRRANKEPLQYILGRWSFLELELAVGPGVLIPRPETEEVCLVAVETLKGQKNPTVLDLCAGTGALALGIQSRVPEARVTAVEISPKAFAYLAQNTAEFAAGHTAAPAPVLGDAFTYYKQLPSKSLDLLVCNPPYVTAAEYATLAPELAHEPKQALVAEDDGLAFYKIISKRYSDVLRPDGTLVFEIGAAQGAAVLAILMNAGYQKIEIRADLSGRSRIATAQNPL